MSTSSHLHTFLQHVGQADFDSHTGAAPVALPSMRTSTVRFKSLDHLDQAAKDRAVGGRSVVYGRAGMDNHRALEDVFCELEAGTHAFLVPSGMAAISLAVMSLVSQGDHIIAVDCAYGPVHALDTHMLQRMGVSTSYCAPSVKGAEAALTPNTKVLYLESPGSLLMQMIDMPALAAFAADHGLIVITDNTWGSGLIYQPLSLGADVSVVAGTKYVSGHSDLLIGAVIVKDDAIAAKINACNYALGYSVSADDVWLALRGVRTMPLRMRECARNALRVCEALSTWPEVKKIYHPAWKGDAHHALWQRDATGSNGLLAVSLDIDKAQARCLVDALELFGIGFSWGGFESLVQLVDPAAVAQHSYWGNSSATLLRLHIGLEHADDLIADLEQALAQAKQFSLFSAEHPLP